MSQVKFQFTEENIANLIASNQSYFCTSYDVLIPNCYTQHDNEADVLAIRKSGLCDELEIKITRSDFFNDAKKIVNYREYECEFGPNATPTSDQIWSKENEHLNHEQRKKIACPWQKLKYDALVDGDMHANYFWYVLKMGIVSAEEVLSWAGVIFVDDNGEFHRVRSPSKLHKGKLDHEQKYKLSKKLAYRFWDYRLGKR